MTVQDKIFFNHFGSYFLASWVADRSTNLLCFTLYFNATNISRDPVQTRDFFFCSFISRFYF